MLRQPVQYSKQLQYLFIENKYTCSQQTIRQIGCFAARGMPQKESTSHLYSRATNTFPVYYVRQAQKTQKNHIDSKYQPTRGWQNAVLLYCRSTLRARVHALVFLPLQKKFCPSVRPPNKQALYALSEPCTVCSAGHLCRACRI